MMSSMADGEGKPVRREHSSEPYKPKLEPDDDAVIIAKRSP
jgi:hypothetical protein